MSLFLAPIHQIMFNKIQYLDSLTKDLMDEDLAQETNRQFKILEEGKLEDLIDTSNIHGWLQERVLLVEDRLAYVSSQLVLAGKEEFVLDSFRQAGKALHFTGGPLEAYQKMEETFLDGMPCDRVNEVLDHSEDSLSWIVQEDVHSIHYQYGVEGNLYHKMRGAWFQGLLSQTDLKLEVQGQKYRIYK